MKKAIQFGAGNIGRGFIGALLSNAGYHVIFADVNQDIISKLDLDKCYTVKIMDEVCSEQTITNISAILSTSEKLITAISEAEIVTTAVGLNILQRIAPSIAKGISARATSGNESYLNIIACENAINGSTTLKQAVYPLLNEREQAFADKFVGFPNCSVDRIVPPVKSENIVDVVVENYYEWNVEKDAFKGGIPKIDGMNTTDNLMAYIERKLFTLNTGHAICSYLGFLKGYKTVDQSIADGEIYQTVKNAMQESGQGLIAKHGFDSDAHAAYIEKIIKRFQNKYLVDDVARVGREPKRKLSPNDRLVKPMLTAHSYGLSVEHLLDGIAACMRYNNPEDAESAMLQASIEQNGVAATFSEVSGIADKAILDKVTQKYQALA